MEINGWQYYNHAAIPTCAPHETPDLTPVKSGAIWKLSGRPLLARWTTDFDCGTETSWWYVIKDTPFDISQLKAKRRYEINKGIKNFRVSRLRTPQDYASEIADVQAEAFSAYPAKYRPVVDKESFAQGISAWQRDDIYVYGAFSREDGRLCGYAYLREEAEAVHFYVLKTRPDSEKSGVNAALVCGILEDFREKLMHGSYISDGARSIYHETAFQDYLEKYFGFRKAYCYLRVKYNPMVAGLVVLLHPFKHLLKKLDSVGIVHKINSLLRMQEFAQGKKI